MTPLQFETAYEPLWQELRAALDLAERVATAPKAKADPPGQRGWFSKGKQKKPALDGARLSALYRRACEHLALAQARAYPIHLTQPLEQLTHRAHRVIYQQHEYGVARFRHWALVDFPQAVRAHRAYLLVACLLFVLPLLSVAWTSYKDPGFILHLVDVSTVQEFDSMYSDSSHALGRTRSADTDWKMFGFYIMHNIGIGFQCFAGGLFAGLGSIYCLVFNGVQIGGVAGYLTARGHSENFYSFVVTHSAFELTAIVLAGAAGLRLGHALVAPGRYSRIESLKRAAADAVVVVYGVMAMLVLAAAVEAFWSSARWVAPAVKYGVGAACWVFVIAYLGWQGRPRQ